MSFYKGLCRITLGWLDVMIGGCRSYFKIMMNMIPKLWSYFILTSQGCIKLPSGGKESSCWERKSIWMKERGREGEGKREEGKGKGKKGVEWKETGKGREGKGEKKGKGKREVKRDESSYKKWEVGGRKSS